MTKLIEIIDLEKVYRRGNEEVYALRGVNLDFDKGEYAAIVGPSGSGKTTLLHIMGCLDRPTRGSVKIDGVSVSELSRAETEKIRRDKIGFVFQEFHLISSLNVQDNILLPLLFSRKKPDWEYLDYVLETVGLQTRKKHRPNELSGGEMQRTAVARSLINRPEIILADEPSGNLDTQNSIKMFELFQTLNNQGITVIIVTHNHELASMSRRQILFRDGLTSFTAQDDAQVC